MSDSMCVNCDDAADERGMGLPLDESGEYVGTHWNGPIASLACCANCYAMHAAVSIPSAPTVEAMVVRNVLSTYRSAMRARAQRISTLRNALRTIASSALSAADATDTPRASV